MGNENRRPHESLPHDVSVYALECKAPSNHPDIEEKYLIPSGLDPNQRPDDSSSSMLLTEIPKDAIYPSDNTHYVHSYEVANADGTRRYPLFKELAARSRTAYYVGQSTTLYERVSQHLRQNGASKFTDALEPITLSRVNSYIVGRPAATLCEQLRTEMLVATKGFNSSQQEVEQNYQWLISKVRSSSHASFSEFSRWIREGGDGDEFRTGFRPQVWWDYRKDVADKGRKKEKEMALDLLGFENSGQAERGETFDIRNLNQYAYWK